MGVEGGYTFTLRPSPDNQALDRKIFHSPVTGVVR